LFDLKLAGIESVVVDRVVVEVPRCVFSESNIRRALRRDDVVPDVVAVLDDRRCCKGGDIIRLARPSPAKSWNEGPEDVVLDLSLVEYGGGGGVQDLDASEASPARDFLLCTLLTVTDLFRTILFWRLR